ncbi:zona pellucida sperm-binding protein 3 [Fundulus heteroclitus]|uniref:zona pellucida sperm-binding protein 3 n=1 Tax=Fundulus heteroclitus TaxID=8078 RepID=UPI00165B48EE|nr:zona pellucida sperm-binding protein 3 [Fundulus heteroclitus]
MGFRAAGLLGFVLLISRGTFCFAAQNRLISGANETLDLTPREQAASSQQAKHLYPVGFRLKTYQLRNPTAPPDEQSLPQSGEEQTQTSTNLQEAEARQLPEQRKTVQAGELISVQAPRTFSPDSGRNASKVVAKPQQPVPAPAESVSVRCSEEKVTVAVKNNFLGNGQLIHPDDLTLGGCMAVDAVDHILLFETELQGCGGTVTMTEVALIYTYPLMYSPTPIGNTSIIKTNPADVAVQCHFQRRQYVSSSAMRPLWKMFSVEMQAEQQLHFSLRLMADDWQSQRPSNVYTVRDMMYVEAAVLQGFHVPLRVFVDSCVVTVDPDPSSQPRYPFIDNHGCLTDAKLTGAQSYFMPRSEEDKLHFQLKAFKFKQDDSGLFYVTCRMKATTVDVAIDSQHKACSFLPEAGRWVASGGDNKVCSCCETSCGGQRWRRGLAADAALEWKGVAVLGPILLKDSDPQEELPPAPVPQLQTRDEALTASYSSTALLCGAGVVLAGVIVFMSTLVCSGHPKPTGHFVST